MRAKHKYRPAMNITINIRRKTQTKSVEFVEPTMTKYKCECLWKKINASKEKLFIVEEPKSTILGTILCSTGFHRWNQQKEGLSTRVIPFKIYDTKVSRL